MYVHVHFLNVPWIDYEYVMKLYMDSFILSGRGPKEALSESAVSWVESRQWQGAAIVILDSHSDSLTGNIQHAGSIGNPKCDKVSEVRFNQCHVNI